MLSVVPLAVSYSLFLLRFCGFNKQICMFVNMPCLSGLYILSYLSSNTRIDE